MSSHKTRDTWLKSRRELDQRKRRTDKLERKRQRRQPNGDDAETPPREEN